MIMVFKKICYSLCFLVGINSWALVDYTDKESSENKSVRSFDSLTGQKSQNSALIWKSDFSLDYSYEQLSLDDEKIGMNYFGLHWQTPFNVYFDAQYWNAQNSKHNTYESGNPHFLLGFNWIRLGNPSDEVQINLMGGIQLKSNSQLAASRTDKIVGIETTKKFGTMGLGLGYEYTMTQEPQRSEDLSIGNVHRIEVSSGWMASNDIQFEIAAENFRIMRSTSSVAKNRLIEDVSFSTLTSKLNLQLFSSFNLELGARFRMQKPVTKVNLETAKIINMHGAYSNSLFAGMLISI